MNQDCGDAPAQQITDSTSLEKIESNFGPESVDLDCEVSFGFVACHAEGTIFLPATCDHP
jgi:hypothetical protein